MMTDEISRKLVGTVMVGSDGRARVEVDAPHLKLPQGEYPLAVLSAKSINDRMTEHVANNYEPIPEAGCWLWLGGRDSGGYGKVGSHGTKTVYATRLFYSFHKGAIPKGMVVCHKCDTPLCINPDHLFLGTQADNMLDKKAKGRGRKPSVKLTNDAIKAALSGDLTRMQLNAQFGITMSQVKGIRRRNLAAVAAAGARDGGQA